MALRACSVVRSCGGRPSDRVVEERAPSDTAKCLEALGEDHAGAYLALPDAVGVLEAIRTDGDAGYRAVRVFVASGQVILVAMRVQEVFV